MIALSVDGLEREEWLRTVSSIETVSEYYDRVNDISTLFQADKWRESAIALSGPELDLLEIGSGPGSFARLLSGRSLVCIEPSEKLIGVARLRTSDNAEFAAGIAEELPIASESFDRVFCSFSFRDFKDRIRSLGEMHRVLRSGGIAVIVDIAKREGTLKSWLIKQYLKRIVPVISAFVIPRSRTKSWGRNPYGELWVTYDHFDTPARYAESMRQIGFEEVGWKLLSMGGAFLLKGVKR